MKVGRVDLEVTRDPSGWLYVKKKLSDPTRVEVRDSGDLWSVGRQPTSGSLRVAAWKSFFDWPSIRDYDSRTIFKGCLAFNCILVGL
ncbi:hypothetical protein PGT21_025844 [Puccinia graminis f. sp. tritici]|uniref:Uncharacterized protein n=1 Tax=Puccinia graminis f. sp. tritici TaxID=56615 RepID=A0A5B0MXY7_PUCGR|nr:hypothetical protein PGT21_025844 [Puccinia graminis f. sp. tritici]